MKKKKEGKKKFQIPICYNDKLNVYFILYYTYIIYNKIIIYYIFILYFLYNIFYFGVHLQKKQ